MARTLLFGPFHIQNSKVFFIIRRYITSAVVNAPLTLDPKSPRCCVWNVIPLWKRTASTNTSQLILLKEIIAVISQNYKNTSYTGCVAASFSVPVAGKYIFRHYKEFWNQTTGHYV